MSGGTNNFPLGTGHRWLGEGYDLDSPNANDRNRVHPMLSRTRFGVGQNGGGGFQAWVPTDERIMGGTWGLSRFSEPPISPLPFRVYEIARTYIPPRQSIPESPPRVMEQMRSLQLPTPEEESRLTKDEQNKALKKLKKEIYNPTPMRMIAKRLSLYYRDKANANARDSRYDEKEDEEKCAICLDDFEAQQPVIRTPCNHLFHEECIVPWVKSHGQCPVCRFAICERMRENFVPPNNNAIARTQIPDDVLIELLRWHI